MKKNKKDVKPHYIRVKEAMIYYNVCRNTLTKFAVEAGALFKVGKTVLIEKDTLDAYIHSKKTIQNADNLTIEHLGYETPTLEEIDEIRDLFMMEG